MVHTRSSAIRSEASIGHSTVSSNPFDDAAPTQSRDQSVVDPTASTASNPFDVFEVQAGAAPSIANTSIHTNLDQDKVLLELRALNENMSRALEALSFLTTSHAHTMSTANTTPAPNFSRPGHISAPSQPLPSDTSAPPHPAPTVDDDISVADSLTSGISISSIRTGKSIRDAVQDLFRESKSKSIKLPPLEDRLQEPAYVRDWCERSLALVSAHPYYSPLLGSDGTFVSPPPEEQNRFLMHETYSVLPQSLKTVVRLSPDLKHSASEFFRYVSKFAIPASLNSSVAEQLHKDFLNLRWDPKHQRLFEYVGSFADLVERLADTAAAPSPSAIVTRWISSLPSSLFDKLQHEFNESHSLPSGWSSEMPIKDLYEETNRYLQRHHPKALSSSSSSSNSTANTDSPHLYHTAPAPYTRKTWKTHMCSKVNTPEFSALANKLPKDTCPICLFKPGATQYHLLADCRLYKHLQEKANSPSSNVNSSNDSVNNYGSNLPSLTTASPPTEPTIYHLRKLSDSSFTPTASHFIVDSGADHIFCMNRWMFSHLLPCPDLKAVTLGDDDTQLPIAGQGLIDVIVPSLQIRFRQLAYFVPTLPTNFFSCKAHLKYNNCHVHGTDNKLIVDFGSSSITTHASQDFSFQVLPAFLSSTATYVFDVEGAALAPSTPKSTPTSHLHQMKTRSKSKSPSLDPIIESEEEHLHTPATTSPAVPMPSTVTQPHDTESPFSDLTQEPIGLNSDIPDLHVVSDDESSDSSTVCSDYLPLDDLPSSDTTAGSKPFLVDISASDLVHQNNVYKYLEGDNDDDSHKAPKNLTASDDQPSDPIASSSDNPRSDSHRKTDSHPENPYFISTSSLVASLTRALTALRTLSPSARRDVTRHSDSTFRSLLPTRSPNPPLSDADHAIISLLASAITSERADTAATFPSDPSPPSDDPDENPDQNPSLEDSSTSPLFQSDTRTLHPPLRPIDRVNSTVPASVTFSSEHLQKCTGFRNISSILPHIRTISAPSVHFADLGRDPLKSRGEVATMPKKARNTTPVSRPDSFGDVFHFDIGYGAGTAIGGYRYALFFVDRKTRYKLIYPLKDLHEDSILFQVKLFVRDIGGFPKRLLADRDMKLLGGAVERYLSPHTILAGAPRNRQNQNGLSEANWRYICDIARNYLSEHLLPNKFWYHALSYAVQVTNYLPIRSDDKSVTSPHFEVYGSQPDYRKLVPLFSTAYVKDIYPSDHQPKFRAQTIKAILVGNDPKSDGQLFFNPATNSVISSADYTLDPTHPSGPLFGLLYDGGLQFSLYDKLSDQHRPTKFQLEDSCIISESFDDPSFHNQPVTVTHVPSPSQSIYTVLHSSTNSLIEIDEAHLQSPSQNATKVNEILQLPWIQHEAKATLLLPDRHWTLPKQGFLLFADGEWAFLPGRSTQPSTRHQPIPLPHFSSQALTMINKGFLAEGWQTHSRFMEHYNTARSQTFLLRRLVLSNTTDPSVAFSRPQIRLRKISAKTLDSHVAPKTLKDHQRLSPSDKEIWDSAYLEEYLGLHETTHTWDYISEAEYQILKQEIGSAIPTMVVSKIKYDQHGKPDRAKYRIVVLGNLDPSNWSAADCFAPVLSALENRLLTVIAAQLKVIPKSGDFIQAFCQSHLPPNERYICKPPANCPITPPNTYLLLRKTLYGLKRSPRHWYETAKKYLEQIGLKACPNAPCIFSGSLTPDGPPIYVGLYVDDFIYFSTCPLTEQEFERRIREDTPLNCTFEGPVSHFLGVRYDHHKDASGNVTIHMSQQSSIDDLLIEARMNSSTNWKPTPYRSGHPVDAIPSENLSLSETQKLQKILQKYTGSLNWLGTQTRPDIATITNILAQYNANPSPGHIQAARYVLQYLKGSSNMGISFSTQPNQTLASFVKYPVDPTQLLPFTDANWGPQDQSVPKPGDPPIHLDLWKSRSISGFIIWLGGPLHWASKRQSITARSSAEAEIYAIDECTKAIQHITNILQDLRLQDRFISGPIPIKNDNAAAVQWSYNMTSKGLRYIQIRENAVREQVVAGLIQPEHQSGDTNIADLFTKEDKSDAHFLSIASTLLTPIPNTTSENPAFNRLSTHSIPSLSVPSSSHAKLRLEGGVVDSSGTELSPLSDRDTPTSLDIPST